MEGARKKVINNITTNNIVSVTTDRSIIQSNQRGDNQDIYVGNTVGGDNIPNDDGRL